MEEKNLVKNVDFKQEWTRKGFHGILHTFFPIGKMPTEALRDYYGDCTTLAVFYVSEDYVNWYWNTADMRRLRKSLIKRVNENPAFLDKLLEDWHARLRIFEGVLREVDSTDLSRLSDGELLDLYNKFNETYISEYALAIGLQDSFSMHAEEFMLPAIKKFLEEKGLGDYFVEYYSVLTAPVDESFIFQERRELLRMLESVQKTPELQELFKKDVGEIEKELAKHEKLRSMLKEHSKQFYWVQNNYAKVRVLDIRFFIEEIKRLLREENVVDASKELEKMSKQIPEMKERKKKLIEELNLPQELRNLIRIGEVFTYMQDERKKYVLISNHYMKIFRDEFGKRLELSEEEMNYTYYRELEELLIDKKVDREKLKLRKKNSMCIFTVDGYQVLEGDEVAKSYDEYFKIKVGVEEIKGMVASKGIAKGIVKVVKKTHDLINVEKGDVLVASMTRPEMVVAMEKACAIVTDEGGLTCHAAIVSRELGIPCIVGTKVATTILKNGDLVEVDADKGTVKKLTQ